MGRKLFRAKLIHQTWMYKGAVSVTLKESDDPEIIHHPDDLISLFPDFDFEFSDD